jgi:hypothetical protein
VRRDGLSPATIAWLAAVGALAVRWGSPLAGFYERAILADVLIGVAAVLFVWEVLNGRIRFRWRPWHFWLAAYAGWIAVAALASPDSSEGLKTFVLVAELSVFAVITACLAEPPRAARALGRVTLAAVAFTFAVTLIALAAFYAGHDTGLIGHYGDIAPSSRYARVRAGFESAPLLASWCIAASAVLAWPRCELPPRWRLAGQCALALVVVTTLSRAVLAFGLALVIRWAAASPERARKVVVAGAAVAVVTVLALLTVGNLRTSPLSYDISQPGARRETAIVAWRATRAHPLVGVGPSNQPGFVYGQGLRRAHVTPLNVAATAGLPALIALAGLAVALWRGRTRPTDIAIWSGLAALLLDGLTLDIDHFRHVWLLIGLAAVTYPREPGVGSEG